MSGFGDEMPPGLAQPDGDVGLGSMVLRVTNGPAAGREFRLASNTSRVGRGDPPRVVPEIDLAECERGSVPMISRNHAELSWVNGEMFLVALMDRNGTWVNGNRLQHRVPGEPSEPVVVRIGDRIRFANLECEAVSGD